jgi:hypothetical protein
MTAILMIRPEKDFRLEKATFLAMKKGRFMRAKIFNCQLVRGFQGFCF